MKYGGGSGGIARYIPTTATSGSWIGGIVDDSEISGNQEV